MDNWKTELDKRDGFRIWFKDFLKSFLMTNLSRIISFITGSLLVILIFVLPNTLIIERFGENWFSVSYIDIVLLKILMGIFSGYLFVFQVIGIDCDYYVSNECVCKLDRSLCKNQCNGNSNNYKYLIKRKTEKSLSIFRFQEIYAKIS